MYTKCHKRFVRPRSWCAACLARSDACRCRRQETAVHASYRVLRTVQAATAIHKSPQNARKHHARSVVAFCIRCSRFVVRAHIAAHMTSATNVTAANTGALLQQLCCWCCLDAAVEENQLEHCKRILAQQLPPAALGGARHMYGANSLRSKGRLRTRFHMYGAMSNLGVHADCPRRTFTAIVVFCEACVLKL